MTMFRALAFFLCCFSLTAHASVLIKQKDMTLNGALSAIAKDMRVKLLNEIAEADGRRSVSHTLSGDGIDLLAQLSAVYDFDWYIYGGTLTVQSGQAYVNYVYKPRNIKPAPLLLELHRTFQTNATVKIKLAERGNSILVSGTRKLLSDVISYARMVDKNQFLESGNNLELARIEFHYISVSDRVIDSYSGSMTFPGAQSLISAALANIGQFQNVSDGDLVNKTYKVKLKQGEKQKLQEEEQTARVQAVPGTNTLLIRGTPAEVQLSKRIAALIDKRRQQLLFSLKVYDIAVDRTEEVEFDSSLLSGIASNIVVPPFIGTLDFLKDFQALYNNGIARGVYSTNLVVLENQQGHFGKKDTATIKLVSNKEVETQKIEADNSMYVTGRLLPSGDVQAKVEYVDESLGGDDLSTGSEPPKVSSQSVSSEVYIKPDQTIILGGFDNTFTQSSESGIPILSKIPLLGNFFKSTKRIKRKYKRYVSISFQVIG